MRRVDVTDLPPSGHLPQVLVGDLLLADLVDGGLAVAGRDGGAAPVALHELRRGVRGAVLLLRALLLGQLEVHATASSVVAIVTTGWLATVPGAVEGEEGAGRGGRVVVVIARSRHGGGGREAPDGFWLLGSDQRAQSTRDG